MLARRRAGSGSCDVGISREAAAVLREVSVLKDQPRYSNDSEALGARYFQRTVYSTANRAKSEAGAFIGGVLI